MAIDWRSMTRRRPTRERTDPKPDTGDRSLTVTPPIRSGDLGGSDRAEPTAGGFGGRIAAFAAVAAVAVAIFLPLAMAGASTNYAGSPSCDMRLQFQFFIRFAVSSLLAGEVPLWNPFIFCGTPFLPCAHAALFHPLNLPLLLALPQPLSVNLILVAHTVVFAVSTAYWARVRGCSPLAAFYAGAAAPLTAAFVPRLFAGHFTIICTLSLFPLLGALQERLFQGSRKAPILMGVVAGIMVLGGHFQYCYYAGLLLFTRLLLEWSVVPKQTDRLGWAIGMFRRHCVALAIAVGVSAIELGHLAEVLPSSARLDSKPSDWLRFFSLPPENLLAFVAPGFLGSGAEYWGRWYWWEVCPWFGCFGLVFWAAALGSRQSRQRILTLAGTFLVALGLSLAGNLPVLDRAVAWLPGWGVFRGHAKILGPALVTAVVVAADGLDALARSTDRVARQAALGVAVALAALSVLVVVAPTTLLAFGYLSDADRMLEFPFSDPAFRATAARTARSAFTGALVASTSAAICALAFGFVRGRTMASVAAIAAVAELALLAGPYASASFPAKGTRLPADAAKTAKSLPPGSRMEFPGLSLMNDAMDEGIETIGGHEINVTKYYDTFLCALNGEPKGSPHLHYTVDGDAALLNAANLRFLVRPGAFDGREEAAMGLRRIPVPGEFNAFSAYDRSASCPRAWIAGSARFVPDREQAVLEALQGMTDFRAEVLLCGEDAGEQTPPTRFAPAEVRREGGRRVIVTAPQTGWLVLADAYSPQWKATVRGRSTEIRRANGAFRAVRVQAGDEVAFTLGRSGWLAGAAVTAFTLLGLIAAGAISLWRGRTKSEAA